MLKKQKNITNISFLNNMIIPILSAISVRNEKLSKILINKRININHSTDIELSPYHFVSYYNITRNFHNIYGYILKSMEEFQFLYNVSRKNN